MPTEDGLLSTAEAAALTGRSYTTISHWARQGHLPVANGSGWYLGQNKFLFRPLDVIRVWVDKEAFCQKQNHRNCKDRGREETLEELEAMIDERRREENLPDWWWKSWEKVARASVADLLKGEDDDE